MSLTLVNLFTGAAGRGGRLRGPLQGGVREVGRHAWLRGHGATSHAGVGDQSYAFVNVAKWTSAKPGVTRCRRSWRQGGLLSGGVVPKAALYEFVYRLPGGGTT